MKRTLIATASAALLGLALMTGAQADDIKAKCVATLSADTTMAPEVQAQTESGCSCLADGVAAGKADAGIVSSALDNPALADRMAALEKDSAAHELTLSCWKL